MRKVVNLFGVMALCLSMAALAGAAPIPTCASLVTINVLNINADGGCTVGDLLFNNFAVVDAGPGTNPGTAEVDLTGVTPGSDAILSFNPNLGFGTSGGTITDLNFTFTVSGGVIGADLSNGGQGSSINEIDCNVNPNGQPCTLGNQVYNTVALSGESSSCLGTTATNTPGASTSVCNFVASVPEIWVFKDISIANASTSHLTFFTESFATPEPMTLSLMGIGLLGLGLLGRRVRR